MSEDDREDSSGAVGPSPEARKALEDALRVSIPLDTEMGALAERVESELGARGYLVRDYSDVQGERDRRSMWLLVLVVGLAIAILVVALAVGLLVNLLNPS